MNPMAVKDSVDFIQEEMEEITIQSGDSSGQGRIGNPLLHNAGEVLAWPENVGAFAIIFQAPGFSWTLSSEELDMTW